MLSVPKHERAEAPFDKLRVTTTAPVMLSVPKHERAEAPFGKLSVTTSALPNRALVIPDGKK